MDFRSVARACITTLHRRRFGVALGAILVVTLLTSMSSRVQALSFPDVLATDPYYVAITDLASRGVIGGYGNADFGPSDLVTRQQLAKMIVKSLGYPVTGNEICPFVDVAKGSASASDPFYPDKYVAVCYAQGWIEPRTAAVFGPLDSVSRAELVAVAVRAIDLPDPPVAYNPPFEALATDEYAWARRAAYAGLLAGLQGMGPSFDFLERASRAECAQVLHNLLVFVQPENTVTTNASATPTPSETLPPTTQPPTDTSVLPSSSTVTSTQATSPEADRGFPTAYLVTGVCVAILVASAAVLLLIRGVGSRRNQRLAPEDPADQPIGDKEERAALEYILAGEAQAGKTPPPQTAGDDDLRGARLWDPLIASAEEAEADSGPSADEPEGRD